MTNQTRSSFTGKIGFVLAAAGSAVGLGNIWRFPYLAAKYGGGIFLFVYLILAITFGFALMTAEIAIGRKTGLSAIGAFQKLSKKFSFVGYLGALVPALILPYYSVIGGWVTKYFFAFVTGGAKTTADGGAYFSAFIASDWEAALWFFLFLGATSLIVLFGVEKGIEKVSKVMMPILAVLAVAVAIYSCTLPGAVEGIKYYFIPDFKHFSFSTLLAAMGQMFYSMSLAMGIMITYGSYMKKEVSIESSVSQIEIFDTGIAFIAGLMVIPAVFSFTGAAPQSPGPGLMFISLPQVFAAMGTVGTIVGAMFFLLVLFAALTSSISLMETVVSIVCDKFKVERKLSCLIVFLVSVLLGLVSCFGYGMWGHITVIGMQFLDFFDFFTNSLLMPIIAFFTCIVVGYVIKTKAIEDEVELSGKFKRKGLFRFVIKYLAPFCLVLILASSVIGVCYEPINNALSSLVGEQNAAAIMKYFVI